MNNQTDKEVEYVNNYEKPMAEFVKFESEEILLELQDIDGPSVGGDVGEW